MIARAKNLITDFSIKKYSIICIFVMALGLLKTLAPVQYKYKLYMYKFGIVNDWLIVYKNKNDGILSLPGVLASSGYKGLEFWPQYILIDALIVYLIYELSVHMIKGIRNK